MKKDHCKRLEEVFKYTLCPSLTGTRWLTMRVHLYNITGSIAGYFHRRHCDRCRNVSNHLGYLWYVLRHKWFVFLECCKLGIPWLGVMHDASCFRLSEFLAYSASAPYSKENKPPEITRAFTHAWNDHQHRNKHHWEYWVHFDYHTHEMRTLPMPDRYRRELIADWRGAGKAQGTPGTGWYEANRDKIKLHPDTRRWIEEQLSL